MKKKMIATLSVLLAALIALTVIANGDFLKKNNSYVDSEDTDDGNKNKKPRDLYPADWETDIFTLKAYTDKDLYLTYGMLSSNTVIYSEKLSTRTECISRGNYPLALMYDYFDLLRHGDHEGINALFSDDYFDGEEKKPYTAFPMQKIYDVLVCKFEYENEEFKQMENVEATYYLVTYKIMENDGMFRYELDADTEIPQIFGILTYADGTSEIYLVLNLPDYNIIKTA